MTDNNTSAPCNFCCCLCISFCNNCYTCWKPHISIVREGENTEVSTRFLCLLFIFSLSSTIKTEICQTYPQEKKNAIETQRFHSVLSTYLNYTGSFLAFFRHSVLFFLQFLLSLQEVFFPDQTCLQE